MAHCDEARKVELDADLIDAVITRGRISAESPCSVAVVARHLNKGTRQPHHTEYCTPTLSSQMVGSAGEKFCCLSWRSSVVFHDSTPTRYILVQTTIAKQQQRFEKHQVGQLQSPKCVVADMMDDFEVSTPGHGDIDSFDNQVINDNESKCTSTVTYNSVHFFSRIFEVITVSGAPLDSTVGDVLKLIPQHVTDGRLLKKNFIGLCRPADRTE